MALGSSIWAFVIIGGPIILGLAIAYGMYRSRKVSDHDPVIDRGTRKLYKELSEEDRRADGESAEGSAGPPTHEHTR